MISNQNAAGYGWSDIKVTLRTKWPLVLLIGSFILLIGAYLSWKRPTIYESESQLFVDQTKSSSPVLRTSTEVRPSSLNSVRRTRKLMSSGESLLRVVEACNLTKRWNQSSRKGALLLLRERINIIPDEKNGFLTIAARDISREGSSFLANTIAEKFIESEKLRARSKTEDHVRGLESELRNRREIKRQIEARLVELNQDHSNSIASEEGEVQDLRSQLIGETHVIRSLEAKHQLAVVEMQNVSAEVSLFELAVPDDARAVGWRTMQLFLFGIFGIGIGCAFVCLISIGKSPVELAADLSADLGLLLVGYAPVINPFSLNKATSEDQIEPYRDLRTQIHRLPAGNSSAILFLPSGDDSETAAVVANTAAVIADGGNSVLVIDGNFREPELHNLFDAAQHPGLADFLSGEMRLEETVIKARKENLWFMPSGPLPRDPSSLLSGRRMDDLLWEMKSRFDYLLLTAPSIHRFSDAGAISTLADHVLVVTSYRDHKVSRLRKTKRALEACHGTMSGVILSQPWESPPAEVHPAEIVEEVLPGPPVVSFSPEPLRRSSTV